MKAEFDFAGELAAACEQLQLPIPDQVAIEKLNRYFLELKKWSRKVNLIARGTADREILEKHFLDSLTLLPTLSGENLHLLDIGTGAGFPGLVCKTAMPELTVTLVEPRFKRVSFLRHIIRTLQLEQIAVLECRVEDKEKLPDDSGFSHITSRAVSEIKLFLSRCDRFAAADTRVICMKGPKWKEELEVFQQSGSKKMFSFAGSTEYILPQSKSIRNVMLFDSIKK